MKGRVVLTTLTAAVLTAAGVSAAAPPAKPKHTPPPRSHEASVPGVAARPLPKALPVGPTVHGTPAVSWPAAGHADVAVPQGHSAQVGSLPVRLGGVGGKAIGSAGVDVLDHDTTTRAGVTGLLMRVRAGGPVSMSVDYSRFRNAYGGDWANRLQLVQLPACALTTPTLAACRATPLATTNDAKAGTATARVGAVPDGTVVALTAAPAGSTGDYTATSVSDAGKWAVATQSGAFSWSYPITVPSVPGGLAPTFEADYSSSAADGLTTTSNNQPSWLGVGWDLSPGFIERSYTSCYDTKKTGDECWVSDNATMSFGGHSSQLVLDGNTGNTWRLKNEDGSRIERLTGTQNGDNDGEYWRLTTTDGTQFYFGKNKIAGRPDTQSAWTVPVTGAPCGGPASCDEAYRWNLDYVVDPHGDSLAYTYQPELNHYGANMGATTAPYTRGGYLLRAEYGTRAGHEGDADAPARVLFNAVDRCLPNATCSQHTTASWPDVPWDQDCAGPCPEKVAPSFWTTKMLDSITTQIATPSGYQPVDSWAFDHSFLDPGDGTGLQLWLHGITHTGQNGGSLATPEITFDQFTDPQHQTTFPNRINSTTDGLPPMDKFRIHKLTNESGGVLTVNYEATDCDPANLPTPQSNTKRCFPIYWTPKGAGPVTDWFAKYVVQSVVQSDPIGGNPTQYTFYDYPADSAAWHYNDSPLVPAAHRSWSEWRGYQKVRVRQGDPSVPGAPVSTTDYLYFRGMDGDHLSTVPRLVTDSQGTSLTDSDQLAGFTRESTTYNGVNGAVVSDVISDPWSRGPTASQSVPGTVGPVQSYFVRVGKNVTRSALSSGGWRTTENDTSYDDYGQVTQVSDLGDLATTNDDQCTTTTYAQNTTTGMVSRPSEVKTVGVACGATAKFPDDAISDERTYYDGLNLDVDFGAAPTHGDATRVDDVVSYSGTKPSFITTKLSSYDGYGRPVSAKDALGRTTTTSYVQTSGLLTSQTVTNPLNQSATTSYDPALGKESTVVDVGGRRTDLTYDPLGRLAAVWKPGNPKSGNGTPDSKYVYTISSTAPSWQSTTTLLANGNTATAYTIFDGFLRARQTQTPAHGTGTGSGQVLGRDITDTYYDQRGDQVRSNAAYYNAGAPSATLQVTADNAVPMQTVDVYDGADRQTDVISREYGTKVWSTHTDYGGDHTDVTPPAGSTPTSTYVDARGQTTQLRQYHGTTPTGTYEATNYTYTKTGAPASIVDASGDTWRYTYDLRGRKIAISDPDRGALTMTYDDDNELSTSTDARNQTLAYKYDDLGRKTEERSGSIVGPLLASWTYDTVSPGLPSSSTRYTNGAAYKESVDAYDPGGRPAKQTVTIPSAETGLDGDYTTTSTYRVDGSPASVGLPSLATAPAETLTYSYDDWGKPSRLTGSVGYVSAASYSENEKLAQLQLGTTFASEVWQTFNYDTSTQRLDESLVQHAGPAINIDDETYTYDPSGNITSETDAFAGQATDTQCFNYDYLQRMSDAWTTTATACGTPGTSVGGPAPYWQTYTYNLLGDRTKLAQHGIGGAADSTYAYTTAGQPHALSNVTTNGHTAQYGYDAAGDTTSRPTPSGANETLTWDADNRLATEGSTSYVYDADGNRLLSHDSTGATLYLANGELHVDPSGNSRKGTRYYTFGGQTIAMRTTAANYVWLTGDNHGTSDVQVDPSTLQATKSRTDPFGNVRGAATAVAGDHGFVGGVTSATTGLTHLGARDYDAALGRFISVDSQLTPSSPATLNPYEYSNNSPATNSDPSGQNWILCDDGTRQQTSCSGHHAPSPQPPPQPPCSCNKNNPSKLRQSQQSDQDYWDIQAAAARYREALKAEARKKLGARLYNDEENAQDLWHERAKMPVKPAPSDQMPTCRSRACQDRSASASYGKSCGQSSGCSNATAAIGEAGKWAYDHINMIAAGLGLCALIPVVDAVCTPLAIVAAGIATFKDGAACVRGEGFDPCLATAVDVGTMGFSKYLDGVREAEESEAVQVGWAKLGQGAFSVMQGVTSWTSETWWGINNYIFHR